jgi:hypothetical protein
MNSVQPPMSPSDSTQRSAIRRILARWRRFEELMDYGPYDHVSDRLQALEARVAMLEAARNSTAGPSNSTPT